MRVLALTRVASPSLENEPLESRRAINVLPGSPKAFDLDIVGLINFRKEL